MLQEFTQDGLKITVNQKQLKCVHYMATITEKLQLQNNMQIIIKLSSL